jgi:hypothetical protein
MPVIFMVVGLSLGGRAVASLADGLARWVALSFPAAGVKQCTTAARWQFGPDG